MPSEPGEYDEMRALWLFIALVFVIGVSCILVLASFCWRYFCNCRRRSRLQGAKHQFRLRREWLEAEFLTVASRSGKPRGLQWKDCLFQDDVVFARDRKEGQLCALVGVAISFETVDGGGMEDNPNVDNLKAGSAVFRFDGRHWSTAGRALLNLDPDEAIERLTNELEIVD